MLNLKQIERSLCANSSQNFYYISKGSTKNLIPSYLFQAKKENALVHLSSKRNAGTSLTLLVFLLIVALNFT